MIWSPWAMWRATDIRRFFRARWGRPLRRLGTDRRGAVAIYIAIAILPMVGLVGIGTDAARAFMVKSRLSSALDSAGLAGGRAFFRDTREADIQMFFDANFPAGYMDAQISGPAVVVDEVAEKIQLSASATVPTTFMSLLGFENITVSAAAEITRQMQILDVVLAIDMSGSMTQSASTGGSRIEAARNAATTMVDILFGDDATKDHLNIGVVPWNGKVNVMVEGTAYDSGLTTDQSVSAFTNPETGAAQDVLYYANNTPVPLLASPPVDWKGCVYSRFLDDSDPVTDADTLYGPAWPAGADWPAWQPIGPEGEPVSGYGLCDLAIGYSECRPCLGHGITPLRNVKQTIVDAIADLQYPDGTTNITQGLGWAWRVLMPESPFTEADPDPEYRRQQAIVLLTDGENYGGPGDGYKGTWGLGGTARPYMDARLLELAGHIKATGAILYVIQFANSGTDLQTLLRQVASGPEAPYYHYAPDGDTLAQVFHEIADHLSELRLSR